MMPTFITRIEGAVMAWYEIINAKSDSYMADRDAEDMLRQVVYPTAADNSCGLKTG